MIGKASTCPAEAPCEEQLLVEAAQADPARFSELYELHFEHVYAFVVRRVRNRDEAEDLTAEVFRCALAGLPRYQWRGVPFAAWLLRIAAHAIASGAHRAQRARDAMALEEPIASGDAHARAELAQIEPRARLFRLVSELPADQRLVLVLRFVEQKPIRDIAAQLSRSEGAVKQLQLRALQSLRARWNGSSKADA